MTTTLMVKEGHMTTTEITVQDAIGTWNFAGTKLVDLSWDTATAIRRRRTPRWTDMVLYRVDNPRSPFKYVLHVIGRSAVYHAHDGRCGQGVETTIAELGNTPRYDDAVACLFCNPEELDDLKNEDKVNVEQDRFQVHRCADVAALIEALQDGSGNIRGLGTQLLRQAAEQDPDIKAYLGVARRI